MPRSCTVCAHPNRAAIDLALIDGTPYRSVAQRYAASPDAVFRHKDHLPVALAKARAASEVARADDLLDHVRTLQSHALRILTQAEAAGDLRTAVAAIREARSCVELFAKLAGEMNAADVNVNQVIHFTIPLRDDEPSIQVIDGEVVESATWKGHSCWAQGNALGAPGSG